DGGGDVRAALLDGPELDLLAVLQLAAGDRGRVVVRDLHLLRPHLEDEGLAGRVQRLDGAVRGLRVRDRLVRSGRGERRREHHRSHRECEYLSHSESPFETETTKVGMNRT